MKVILRAFGRSSYDEIAGARFFSSDVSISEMASAAAELCVKESGITPDDYDLVILCSESFWDVPQGSRYTEREYRALRDEMLHSFAHDLGLTRAAVVGTWMSACGNALPALELAYAAITSGRSSNVLVISADRAAPSAGRDMPSGLAAFSDIAAAVCLSNDGHGPELVDILLQASPGLLRAHRSADPLALALELRKGLSSLDRRLYAKLGKRLADTDCALFENLRPTFIESAAETVGLPTGRIQLPGHSAPGHAFSADLILALQDAVRAGQTGLISAISLASWTLGVAIVRIAHS